MALSRAPPPTPSVSQRFLFLIAWTDFSSNTFPEYYS